MWGPKYTLNNFSYQTCVVFVFVYNKSLLAAFKTGFEYLFQDQERVDPMAKVFPKVSFRKYNSTNDVSYIFTKFKEVSKLKTFKKRYREKGKCPSIFSINLISMNALNISSFIYFSDHSSNYWIQLPFHLYIQGLQIER